MCPKYFHLSFFVADNLSVVESLQTRQSKWCYKGDKENIQKIGGGDQGWVVPGNCGLEKYMH